MRKINIIVIAIVLLSIVFVISGCGGSNTNTTLTQSSPTSVQSPQSSPSTIPSTASTQITLDNFRFSPTDNQVISLLGQPEEKSKVKYVDNSESTGEKYYLQNWNYPSKGITLYMHSSTQNGTKYASMVSIKDPCKYQTVKSVGIGSTMDEVITAYKNDIISTKDELKYGKIIVNTTSDTSQLVGFFIDNNKVKEIKLGSFGEE